MGNTQTTKSANQLDDKARALFDLEDARALSLAASNPDAPAERFDERPGRMQAVNIYLRGVFTHQMRYKGTPRQARAAALRQASHPSDELYAIVCAVMRGA